MRGYYCGGYGYDSHPCYLYSPYFDRNIAYVCYIYRYLHIHLNTYVVYAERNIVVDNDNDEKVKIKMKNMIKKGRQR